MSIENGPAPAVPPVPGASPAVVPPLCPHCRAPLPSVSWNTMGPVGVTPNEHPALFVVFFCPACRVTLNCQLMPMSALIQPTRPAVVIPSERFRAPGGRG